MQFSLILTSLFCFTTRVNMVRAIDCDCVVLSKTRVPHSKIKEYTIQDDDGDCLFRAIVFRTVGGKTICSNPKDDWANHVIQLLKKSQNPNISKDSSGSESPSGPSTAQESEQTGTPALAPGSELPSAPALVPSTPATASGLEQTGTPALVPSMSSMSPGSEQTTAPTSALGSETPSTPLVAAPSGPASLSESESTSEPTSAPSTETSASSTAPSSTPSSTTLNPISAKSTPNPTSAPNTTSGASGTRSALHHILATSLTTRRASTQRRSTLSRR